LWTSSGRTGSNAGATPKATPRTPHIGRQKGRHPSRPRYLRDKRWRVVPARANGQLAFGNYRWDEQREAFELSVLTEGIAEITTFLGAELPLRFGLPDEL
jgi:hypothetical protein